MNKKQLLIALAVFAVVLIAGAVLILLESSAWNSTTSEKGRRILENYDVNKIECIKIKSPSSSLTIQKKDSSWVLPESSSFPADFDMIRTLINNVWNMKVAQKSKFSKNDLAKFDLVEPGKGQNPGTLLEFFDKDNKKIVALVFGKQHLPQPSTDMPALSAASSLPPDGRYVVNTEKPAAVYLIAETFDIVQPAIPLWRSKENLKIENISSISSSSQKPAFSWKFAKKTEADNFMLDGLKKGEATDETHIQSFVQNLLSLQISDVLPYSKLAETGLDSQDANFFSVTTFDNFTYNIKISQKNGKYYMKYDVAFNPLSQVEKDFSTASEKDSAKSDLKTIELNDKDASLKAKADSEKRLRAKFNREKALSQWIYVIPENSAVALLKDRADFLKKAAAPAKEEKKTQPAKKAPAKKTQKKH